MVPIAEADASGRALSAKSRHRLGEAAKGMTSCLISGGCDRSGKVPVTSHLAKVAALRPGRILNWHVGMLDEAEVRTIVPYLDIVSFDFVGDDETIREVYSLDYTVGDYLRTYAMLRRYATVVPHLTLGLRGGQFSGEYQALDLLKATGLPALVVLVLMPTPGTRYAGCKPPALDQVEEFLLVARRALRDTPIHLGCMRPGGSYRRELDPLAVRVGVNNIVNPAPSAVRLATELGLEVRWRDECCVIQRP
jgi:uncharacterized radical SAM superfamily protein